MGRPIRIDQYVKDAIEEYPRAAEDDDMLIGLVYERYLGEERAGFYGFRWCKSNYEKLKLPSPEAVCRAKEQYIKRKKE